MKNDQLYFYQIMFYQTKINENCNKCSANKWDFIAVLLEFKCYNISLKKMCLIVIKTIVAM